MGSSGTAEHVGRTGLCRFGGDDLNVSCPLERRIQQSWGVLGDAPADLGTSPSIDPHRRSPSLPMACAPGRPREPLLPSPLALPRHTYSPPATTRRIALPGIDSSHITLPLASFTPAGQDRWILPIDGPCLTSVFSSTDCRPPPPPPQAQHDTRSISNTGPWWTLLGTRARPKCRSDRSSAFIDKYR